MAISPIPQSGEKQQEAIKEFQGIEVVRDRITLGDITHTLPTELFEVDVAPAPNPGTVQIVGREAMAQALERAGADKALANGLPAYVQVRRASKALTLEELTKETQEQVQRKLPLGVSVSKVLGGRAITLPAGPHQLTVQLSKLHRSTAVTVRVESQGRTWAVMPLTVNLEGQPVTPVLNRDLPANAVIRDKDIKMVPGELDNIQPGHALRAADITGKQLNNAGRAGQLVPVSGLQEPPMISRGREVSLIATAPGITVSQPAIAAEDGREGQWIRVKPLAGSRELKALVISGGEVRLEMGGR